MIRKHQRFNRPKRLYITSRIAEENKLCEKYGLKNKREVWKADAKITYYRDRAKALAKSPMEEQEVLFKKLTAIGIPVNSIADVLALQTVNLLERRLPTILVAQGKAPTAQAARQMVSHKRVSINGNVVNVPSYIVRVDEEQAITVKPAKVSAKPATESAQSSESPAEESA